MINPWKVIKTPDKDVRALRADENHPLELFWAKDHMDRYLFVYEYPSSSIVVINDPPSLDGIETKTGKASKTVSRLILILVDKINWELFYALCNDLMIATSRSVRPETASSIILTRLRRWQDFLKKKRSDILPEEKIKGLIGELIFLKNQLIPKYGCTDAIKFWQGPEGAPQDFNINNAAIEVKCQIGGTIPIIKISSANQLYTQLPKLYLYVVTMGKSDKNNSESLNLPFLVSHIQKLLERDSSSSISRFQDLLMEAGYFYKEKYLDFNYILSATQVFEVKDNFPRIIPSELKPGITKLSYNIGLNECVPYEIELINWEF